MRAGTHAAEAGGAAAHELTWAHRGLRPGAAADRAPLPSVGRAARPCAATPSPRPGLSFYRVVLWAAGGAARRGARSADAGRSGSAAGSSLAAALLPIVGGGRRVLPAALGPGGGAACARREERAAAAPRPPPWVEEEARRGARHPQPLPPPGRSGSDFSALHFVFLSAHGRLMEGRVHRPL